MCLNQTVIKGWLVRIAPLKYDFRSLEGNRLLLTKGMWRIRHIPWNKLISVIPQLSVETLSSSPRVTGRTVYLRQRKYTLSYDITVL